ncbi:MAG: hypothetical protein JKX79_04375 [Labilibaculum sp.]|nr:hypothetical protein [Labilibaculum sp.]
MKTIKNIAVLLLTLVVMTSYAQEKKKGRFSFDEIKAELNLTTEQTQKFDVVIAKYTKIREESFAGFRESGAKPNRSVMMKKMQGIQKLQNEEITAFLTSEQLPSYEAFAEKMAHFGKPGYSDKEIQKMTTELALDESQVKMLNAVNKAFEKSFSDAHDLYHGNAELAKEYRTKYDQERKNVLQKVFNEEQYTKYLEIVKELDSKRNMDRK